MALTGFTWVIEGDVKACFDEISHTAILGCIREKVIDNKFLALIQLLLKAGVEIDGVLHPTTKGVPQGGVASPLLANIVLNKLDWFLHSKGFHDGARIRRCVHNEPNVRFCRYADDWCVFLTRSSREQAEQLRDEIREFLRNTCGLELSAEKTRITHVRDGYDYLGFQLSVDVGTSGNLSPKVRVGRKAIANIQQRLGEVLRHRPMQESISVRLECASAVIRGWSNYFKAAHNFSKVAHGLDHRAFWIAVKAICRKEDISTAQCLRKYRLQNTIGVHEDCALARFQDTAPAYYYSSPQPYQPGCHQPYPEDAEWEAAFLLPIVGGLDAATSSGRLWYATAFIAVDWRSRLSTPWDGCLRRPKRRSSAAAKRLRAGLKAMEFLKYDTMVRGPRPPKALPFLHPLIYPTGLVSHGTKPHRQAFTSSGGGIGWFRRRAPTI